VLDIIATIPDHAGRLGIGAVGRGKRSLKMPL